MVKILHIANRRSQIDPDGLLAASVRELGELTLVEQGRERSDAEVAALMRDADVVVTNWASRPIPEAVASEPGRLRYVLCLGGTCKATVPLALIRAGIPVTNWGDQPAQSVAEGAMSLFLAVLKDLRPRTEGLLAGRGAESRKLGLPSGTVNGLKLGLYGCGAIGRRFVEMVRPFKPSISIYDPYAEDLPEGCLPVPTLARLFERSEAIVVWTGLSEETRRSVTAELLAKLPDHGIIVNAARGEIIDQEALFDELRAGRLRAGLDVLVGDNYLPEGHEAHTWPNLLITSHDISKAHWPVRPASLGYADHIVIDNLRRFISGEPLKFIMDEQRYMRSS